MKDKKPQKKGLTLEEQKAIIANLNRNPLITKSLQESSRIYSRKYGMTYYEMLSEAGDWFLSSLEAIQRWIDTKEEAHVRNLIIKSVGLHVYNSRKREQEHYSYYIVHDFAESPDYLDYTADNSFYDSSERLEGFLSLVGLDIKAITPEQWENASQGRSEADKDTIMTELNSVYYALPSEKREFIKIAFSGITVNHLAAIYGVKESSISQRKKRTVKDFQLKLRSIYSMVDN